MSRKFIILVFCLLLLVAWFFLAPFFATGLIVEKPLDKADAVLVLSGASVYVERAQKAAEIFKNGRTEKIFLTDDGEQSGWSKIEQRNPKFAELSRKILLESGVPSENIEILEGEVAGTIDEARLARKNFEAGKFKSLLLVTSAYHTRRSFMTFEKVFSGTDAVIGIEAVSPGFQTPPVAYWWLSAAGWKMVAGEYVKEIYYRIFY
jgi:Uncharacterized conserved protein